MKTCQAARGQWKAAGRYRRHVQRSVWRGRGGVYVPVINRRHGSQSRSFAETTSICGTYSTSTTTSATEASCLDCCTEGRWFGIVEAGRNRIEERARRGRGCEADNLISSCAYVVVTRPRDTNVCESDRTEARHSSEQGAAAVNKEPSPRDQRRGRGRRR